MPRIAVFDLDRTLIAGSSAQVFGQMLRDMGVPMPSPPGQSAYFALYERFGEDPIMMRVARHASRLFAGQPATKVETAGRLAADVLVSTVLPDAQATLAKHRSEGTELLLATTAPHELAAPLAEALNFDGVLCTKYRVVDGVFDGENDGRYLWGDEKADAVAEWAGSRGADLTESFAYSDSWYDIPLLELVGHPVAVNADVRLNVLAKTRGWQRRRWAAS